jgi:hypothetical protein
VQELKMGIKEALHLELEDLNCYAKVRRGESDRTWYRSDRVFRCNGQWYFHTREGFHVGPFKTQFDAEVEAGLLIKKLRDVGSDQISQVIREHMLDSQGGSELLKTEEFTDYLVAVGGVELLR